MTLFDYGVLLILCASTLVGLWRGAVREIFSLALTVFGAWVALYLSVPVAAELQERFPEAALFASPLLARGTAFALVWSIATVAGGVFLHLVEKVLKAMGLGEVNHLLGGMFGFLRAGVIVVAVAWVTQLIPDGKGMIRERSFIGPYLVPVANWVEQRSLGSGMQSVGAL